MLNSGGIEPLSSSPFRGHNIPLESISWISIKQIFRISTYIKKRHIIARGQFTQKRRRACQYLPQRWVDWLVKPNSQEPLWARVLCLNLVWIQTVKQSNVILYFHLSFSYPWTVWTPTPQQSALMLECCFTNAKRRSVHNWLGRAFSKSQNSVRVCCRNIGRP